MEFMAKKKATIDDLTRMVKRGFDETGRRIDILAVDLKDVKEKVDNILKILLKQHESEIKELAKRVRRLEDMFAVK